MLILLTDLVITQFENGTLFKDFTRTARAAPL
jgi:hypothetical protein